MRVIHVYFFANLPDIVPTANMDHPDEPGEFVFVDFVIEDKEALEGVEALLFVGGQGHGLAAERACAGIGRPGPTLRRRPIGSAACRDSEASVVAQSPTPSSRPGRPSTSTSRTNSP